MKRINPDYLRFVMEGVRESPYFELLTMQVISLEPGRSHIEIPVQEKHLQPFGNVHGGVFSSLMDAACFWAVWPQLDANMGMTTVDLKLNYLAPVNQGKLVGRGKTIKMGKTLCLAEASIQDGDGKLLAHGTSTLMLLKDLQLPHVEGLPPKFLK